MAKQPDKKDCKVCKKLFTTKDPNLMMTDDDHTVIKCMASDVDSSDSCSEKGQGHVTKVQAQGHKAADKAIRDKPTPITGLSVKPKTVAELLYYDGDSSDSCSEKGYGQRLDNVKAKDQIWSHNLATKPPKVKSLKPLCGTMTHLDGKHSGSKPLAREKSAKSSRKIKLSPGENDNLEREIQTKIANRSHLQHIIDEAMDHFQKLSSKSASIHDNVKVTKISQFDSEKSNFKEDKDDKTMVHDSLKEMNERNIESHKTDFKRDKVHSPTKVLESSGELDRTAIPERPSSRENMISPSQRHLISPNSENRSSPNGSVSGSRRKLPQPPRHKLRCSVTSLVHSSIDSDSSRPDSSADFSDVSDCSNVSKGETANNLGNVSAHKPSHDSNNVMNTGNVFVNSVTDVEGKESQKFRDMKDVRGHTNTESCDMTKDVKVDRHKDIKTTYKTDCDASEVIGGNIGRLSEHENIGEKIDKIRSNEHNLNESGIYESRRGTPCGKPSNNLDMLDISATSSSDGTSATESLETATDKSDQCSSDNVSAIDKSNCESGKENELIPPKHKHVSRSPSYKKKVMAKARSRYHRQLIELKCKTGECNGNCSICGSQNSEIVPRSHTSLGVPVESITEEQYLEQSSPRRAFTPEPAQIPITRSPSSGQRSLKRVPVSSRVDLLMSNNLFKKHLTKHEDLLQKHTLSYRKFGLQKAVSNLDLSEGLLFDETDTNENLHGNSNLEETMLNSSLKLTSSKPKHTSRRYSLTGESEFPDFNDVQNLDQIQEKKTHILTSQATIPSLDEYRASNKSRQTQAPSFAEFRQNRSQKRRILPSNTNIRSSDNNSSQVTEKVNQNESANVSNSSKDRSVHGQEAEVSEITVSIGHLDTIVESSLQTNEHEAAISKHVPKLENKNSENKEFVISDSSAGGLETKHNEVGHSEENKNAETNIAAAESSLESTEKFDSVFVSESLNVEDKSPLSTAELDSAEINPPRHVHSETDSIGSQDVSYSDLSSSGVTNRSDNKSATKERHRKGAKRPRSLISKKSSLVSLIKESEQKESLASSVANRPTVKRRNSLNSFPKGDDGSDKDRADSFRSVKSEGQGHKQHEGCDEIRSLQNKAEHSVGLTKGGHSGGIEGSNSVTFTLENDAQSEASQDVRGTESEVASLPGSVASESLNSEVSGLHEDDGAVFSETFELEIQDDMSLQPKSSKDDASAPVLRSTSDACDATPEALKKRRERKERPYKSDPFSGTEIIPASKRYYIREERARLGQHKSFANSSREEILDFLDVVSSQGKVPPADSFPSLEELNEDDEQNLSVSDVTSDHTKKVRNVTRSASSASTDSGVIGQEESHDSQQSSPSNTLTRYQRSSWSEFRRVTGTQPHLSASCSDLSKAEMDGCLDCDHARTLDIQNNVLQICSQCYQRRVERKKTMQEIIETEVSYGRDLNILKEEFYEPMKKTCLLNKDQLDSIFLNLDELIHVNTYFLGKLRAAVNTANHNNDEDLQKVRIGSLYLESSSMFLTFENYCVNQAQAPVLLEQLEREKELLRIFLHVSQNDNHLLRRMHLKSFLMVPVQRIMKYPMLLDRLYKATPSKNEDKESIKEAKEKIEDILGHINAKSKVSITGSIKQSQKRKLSERHCSMSEKIEVLRVALESLGWSRKDVCDVITSRLHLAVPADHLWAAKKCKNLKFTPALGVLLTLGEPSFEQSDKNLVFPNNSAVRSAAVVLIREKNGKYQVMRDPLMLDKCVVSQDPDFTEVFEVLEWSKESLLIKADSQTETNQWVLYLRQQMQQLGCWRKRRNALPNILLNHLSQ